MTARRTAGSRPSTGRRALRVVVWAAAPLLLSIAALRFSMPMWIGHDGDHAGDNWQLWFRAPDGTLYAASGSAMARSFLRPRITELAAGEVQYGWPEYQPLLDAGEQPCVE